MNTLKKTRENLQMTQSEVATNAGMSEQQYQLYEYDKREPGVRTAIRIAKALHTTVETLWGDNTNAPGGNPAK